MIGLIDIRLFFCGNTIFTKKIKNGICTYENNSRSHEFDHYLSQVRWLVFAMLDSVQTNPINFKNSIFFLFKKAELKAY